MSRTVLYTCPFVPAGWIAAHGLAPRRIVPRVAGRCVSASGVCPYAAAFAEEVLNHGPGAAAVFTTRCDQMRRLFDLTRARHGGPMFLLNVPTVKQATAGPMYVEELRRLGGFLQAIGGTSPNWRAGANFPTAVAATAGQQWGRDGGRVRLAVVGGPLPDASLFFEQVRAAGGQIVLDATETGERLQPATIDQRRWAEDPLRELARVYLEMPSVHDRPNNALYRWLADRVTELGVSGLILRRYVWCDLWHAEARRLAEGINVPLLDLQIESAGVAENTRSLTRLSGFVEMLQQSLAGVRS